MYINVRYLSNKFKSGGLHEKHAVAIWIIGNISSFTYTRGADKSLVRPGRKQAAATKLGVY